MEKFVLTPVKTFDKIAKYSPENANIQLLIDADEKKDQLTDSNIDPVLKSYLHLLNNRDIETFRQKVFPHDKEVPPVNEVVNYTTNVTKTTNEGSINEEAVKKETKNENKKVEEKVERDKLQSAPALKDPPTKVAEKAVVKEVPVSEKKQEIVEQEKINEDGPHDVSGDTTRRYVNAQHMREMIDNEVPFEKLSVNHLGHVFRDGRRIPNGDIKPILNFLTTPGARYAAGASTVLQHLLNVPSFDINMVENQTAIDGLLGRNPDVLKKVGGKLPSKIILIDKLPYKVKRRMKV